MNRLIKYIAVLTLLTAVLTGCSQKEAGREESAVRIGSLKGPTSMGLVSLMEKAGNQESLHAYDFTMVTAPDELLTKVIGGELDIAMIPANVAGVLYNKTEGEISVLNINTLGVLYIVENGDTIHSLSDLKGRTLYLTGKGTTPDYVLSYLLNTGGLAEGDVNLEYKSEAAEVAAVLAEQPDAAGLLPQPFVTAAMAQNERLRIALDLNQEWKDIQGEEGSSLVTGVTVVRNGFLDENKDLIDDFLSEYKESAEYTNQNVAEAAELIAGLGIVPKADIAVKAIPYCNITYIDGEDMKKALSGYLNVLYEQNPQSIGGKLPAEDFYYVR